MNMKIPKGKNRQHFLDNDVIAKKREGYFEPPHGVGANTPGGEVENSIPDIIGRPSIMGKRGDGNVN